MLNAARYTQAAFTGLWARIGNTGDPARHAATIATATLHRWTLDPVSGSAKEEAQDDRGIEFPTFNDALLGRPSRYLYTVGQNSNAIVKYDHQTGAAQVRETGDDTGEAVFVAAEGARAEDEGWLLSVVTTGGHSELLVLDATDLSDVASVRLPSVCRPVSTGLGWRTPRASKRWLTLRVAGVRQAQSDQPPTVRIARHEAYIVQPRGLRILSG